jgi:hypothetical protein
MVLPFTNYSLFHFRDGLLADLFDFLAGILNVLTHAVDRMAAKRTQAGQYQSKPDHYFC